MPNAIDVVGIAKSDATVTVNGQSTYRKGEFYQKALTVNNGSATNQAVTNIATSGTSVTKLGTVFVPPGTESFSYDADGNLTQDARWNYTWDAENRLIRLVGRVSGVQPTQVDYEYDWRGRRIKKVVTGGATSKYLYDGWNLVAEIDGANALVRSYMWGLDLSDSVQGAGGVGGLIYTKPAAGTAHFCAYDGNGNVMALVDGGNGNVSAEYECGAFGEPIRATGTMATANPFRFSTKFTDDESDFLYYGYRYYNASVGRWVGRDPIGENDVPNPYCFVFNDPAGGVDPSGLATYRLEVVVGDRFSRSGAGRWSQPSWAGSGDYDVRGASAWSKVTVGNASFYGVHTPGGDYCNTVDYKGDRGDAGEIRVFAADECGGRFRLEFAFSTYLHGDGPIKVKAQATLRSEHKVLWNGKAAGSPHAELLHGKVYSTDFSLKAGKEQLVLRYTPVIAFPIPLKGAAPTTGSANGYIGVLSLSKL